MSNNFDIKKFNFPSFEEWYKKRDVMLSIGEYTVRILGSEKDNGITQFSAYLYVGDYMTSDDRCSRVVFEDFKKSQIKEWYDSMTKMLNEKFVNIIMDRYLTDTEVLEWVATDKENEWFGPIYVCPYCGFEMIQTTRFCGECGKKLKRPKNN
jgi:hypothetical protein